jgi:hypothetical protein
VAVEPSGARRPEDGEVPVGRPPSTHGPATITKAMRLAK